MDKPMFALFMGKKLIQHHISIGAAHHHMLVTKRCHIRQWRAVAGKKHGWHMCRLSHLIQDNRPLTYSQPKNAKVCVDNGR